MNYSKNLKRNIIVGIISGVAAGASICAVGSHISGKDSSEKMVQIIRQDNTKVSVYGVYDDLDMTVDGTVYSVHMNPEEQ